MKGYQSKTESFAEGGAVLGRTTDFMKTPDRFREAKGRIDNFGKGEKGSSQQTCAPAEKGKSLPLPKK